MQEGAKLAIVAPTMNSGVMNILAWITGVPVDSTLAATVFDSIIGADALKSVGKKSSLVSE